MNELKTQTIKEAARFQGNAFHKLNASGELLDVSAKEWSGVYDAKYELYWESKTSDGGLRDFRNRYRWGGKGVIHNQKTNFLKGLFGKKKKEKYTDWNELVDAANAEALCGFTDWRMPTLYELKTLTTHHSNNKKVSITWSSNFDDRIYINPEYFPLMQMIEHPCCWSACASDVQEGHAWAVNYYVVVEGGCDGHVTYEFEDLVRLVRSHNDPLM